MNFNLQVSNQSSSTLHSLKASLYKNVYEATQKSQAMRLTGLGLGLSSGALTLSSRIGLIGENIIKGIGNIFGAPFSDKCKFSTGLKQLFFNAPKNIIILPFSCGYAIFEVFQNTLMMAINPRQFAYQQWIQHDPQEKQAHQKRIPQKNQEIEKQQAIAKQEQEKTEAHAKQQQEKAQFDQACVFLTLEPKNIAAIKQLAQCYRNGLGTAKNTKEAYSLYQKTANLGDIESNYLVAEQCKLKGDNDKFLQHMQIAASANSPEAIRSLAEYYLKIQDDQNAVEWLKKGIKIQNAFCMFEYAKLREFGKGVDKNSHEALDLMRSCVKQKYTPSIGYLAYLLHKHKSENPSYMKEIVSLLELAPKEDIKPYYCNAAIDEGASNSLTEINFDIIWRLAMPGLSKKLQESQELNKMYRKMYTMDDLTAAGKF